MRSFLSFLEQYNYRLNQTLSAESSTSTLIIQYIKSHLEDNLTRDMIAKELFMSKDYISKVFRQETGMSFIAYINKQKIDAARRYLIETTRPVSEIAFCLGITNFSYFTRLFKKETGMSPREFRKNSHINNSV